MTSEFTRSKDQPRRFWIMCGKLCKTWSIKRLVPPTTCTAEASITRGKHENAIRRQSGTFARANEP
ncbi:hypothetical protein JH26_10990 [Microvirga sp. BSC39]|nr:hypothetical protein JH26_10990 [Microvirga sp. BSC39]